MIKSIYLIGSLRNPNIREVARKLRSHSYEVFDDWHGTHAEADDCWQKYCVSRGWSYTQALAGPSAQATFSLDKAYIEKQDAVVMVLPAGRSAHLELGYARGIGKPGFILLNGKVDRYDVMYNFATAIVPDLASLYVALKAHK